MSKTEKNMLIVAICMAMFLAAIESTILLLAIPIIVKDLHGFDLISHVFSVYLLTSAISTPVYGKMSDMYGRKNAMLVGMTIFIAGSAFCGLSQTMVVLIISRAIKGLGAGSILTVSFTIVGDVFPLNERGKIQGAISMVWGVAALIGPFVGGLLINFLSWHWIFFIVIPLGVPTFFIIQTKFNETIVKRKHRIDVSGIISLSLAMIAFLSIFILGEEGGTWLNIRNILLFIISAVMLFVFYRIEKRAVEPLVPFDVLTKSSIFINLIAMIFTGVLIGVDVYTPIYLQNVRGFGPLVAGLILLPMSVSWTLVSIPMGKLVIRFGGKPVNLVGTILTIISLVPILVFTKNSEVAFLIAAIFFMGIGLGIGMTTQTMLIQESVGFEKRGSAIAVNTLLKTLGQTIGISVFGAVFNGTIVKGFSQAGITEYNLGNLYDLSSYSSGVSWDQIVDVLTTAIHTVGLIFICMTIVCIVLSAIMPRPPISERSLNSNNAENQE